MHLNRLQLSNFKNHPDTDFAFCPNVNCLVGNNGVGKTNVLDAIYYLSFCKSYFNPIDSQNILHGQEFFAVHGHYEGLQEEGVETLVSCVLKKGQNKQLKYNKKAVSAFAEHIGRIPLVIVTPSDQTLILGGSEVRRKFMDGVISQADKSYLQSLLQYQKAVEQRNRLLKQCYEDRYFDEEAIALWDEQLVRFGEPIHEARCRFLEGFMPLFRNYFALISNQVAEVPAIEHLSQLREPTPFADQLREARKRDSVVLYTTAGPHKDDLDFLLSDYQVRKFGSQGQQKTYLLALKLAQFEYISQQTGIKPILLLDDIFDKLDLLRVKQLVRLVGSTRFGQVFITDTQEGRVEAIFEESPDMEHRIFNL